MDSYEEFADHNDPQVRQMAAVTAKWLGKLHSNISKLQLDMSTADGSDSATKGILPTISCQLTYGGDRQ